MIGTSEDLRAALGDPQCGRVIELAEGQFLGPFAVGRSVTLRGRGPHTVLWHPVGPVLNVHVAGVQVCHLSLESPACSRQNLVQGRPVELRDVQERGACTRPLLNLPAFIDFGAIPPRHDASMLVRVDARCAVTLAPACGLLSVKPSALPAGFSRLRLQVVGRHLADGDLVIAWLIIRSDGERVDVPVRACVQHGVPPVRPAIHVPEDAPTLAQAVAMASPSDRIVLASGKWPCDVVLEKNLVIEAEGEPLSAVLTADRGPVLDVRAAVFIRGVQVEVDDGPALQCRAYARIVDCSICARHGTGIATQTGALVELAGTEVKECGEYGLRVGTGSSALIENSMVHHNRRSNLWVEAGGQARVIRSGLQASLHGSGAVTEGFLEALDCAMVRNAVVGLWVLSGGRASVEAGQFEGNSRRDVSVGTGGEAQLAGATFMRPLTEAVRAEPGAIVRVEAPGT